MEESDTIRLLRECDAGTKMAVASFDEVIKEVKDENLKQMLTHSREMHEAYGNELHEVLLRYGSEAKEPNPVAKSMSWMKTNMKMALNESDATIADLMTDGCNMGVKSLCRYLNKYEAAEEETKGLCRRLIEMEETLTKDLQSFL